MIEFFVDFTAANLKPISPSGKERHTEPRGTVRFLSIKAAGCDGALAQLNLENSPTHHLSRIGNEKRPSRAGIQPIAGIANGKAPFQA